MGHSTRPFDLFLALLSAHGIETVADVRRYPGSRRWPQFSRDALSEALGAHGIAYQWFPDLAAGATPQQTRSTRDGGTRPSEATPITWRPASLPTVS